MSGAIRVSLILGALGLPAAAHSQVPRLSQPVSRPVLRMTQAMPAPQAVVASSTGDGVQISWQPVAEAARYQVFRGPGGSATGSQIGEVPASELTFLDRGFNEPAAYQIIAMAADGRTAASALAQYTPPAKTITAAAVAPVVTKPAIIKREFAQVPSQPLASTASPVIETVGSNVHSGLFIYNGDTVQVTGSGLDGLSGVYLVGAYCHQFGCQVNPGAGPPVPVTPFRVSAGGFSFVPQVHAPVLNQSYQHFLIVTKGSAADTSSKLEIGATRPVKKITSVQQSVVRSGLRIQVYGVGFDEVEGAYFGNGTPGSQNNLLYSIANRSSTSIQIMTTSTCNQLGILMLRETPTGSGSPGLITGDTAIRVGCASATPAGHIFNSPSMPNGHTYVMPGEKIVIQGTNLRFVTGVVDQRNTSHPFTFAPGFQSVPDQITVTIPSVHPDRNLASYAFRLDNSLTEPVLEGPVTGTATVMAAPRWTSISRGWAEPGQQLQVTGSDLFFGQNPQVTVGGVPAEVTLATQNYVNFRLGAATTAGPIRIQHQAGAVELTGSFAYGYPSKTHPGFFVVSGPSSVTEIVRPRPTLAMGDTLVFRGQNLVRLRGICLLSSGQGTASAGYVPFMRASGSGLQYEVSNTEMQVVFGHTPVSVAPGLVQLYAYPPQANPNVSTQPACSTNPAGIQWP